MAHFSLYYFFNFKVWIIIANSKLFLYRSIASVRFACVYINVYIYLYFVVAVIYFHSRSLDFANQCKW